MYSPNTASSDSPDDSDSDYDTDSDSEGETHTPSAPDNTRPKRPATNTPLTTTKERRKARLLNSLRIDMHDTPGRRSSAEGEAAHAYIASSADEPANYNTAINSPHATEWIASMRDELASLHRQHVWDIVTREPDMRTVDPKWALRIKHDENNKPVRFKSRLVARGFTQLAGVDYNATSAPVVSKEAVRTALALAAHHNWVIQQFDVNTAYLYATLEETIFMEPPPGLLELWGDNLSSRDIELLRNNQAVLCLNKALYGLRQSGRRWYETIRDYLRNTCGLQPTAVEPCVFVGNNIILLLYVDDGFIITPTLPEADSLLSTLEREYDIKRLGTPRHFLGWTIVQGEHGGITIHQRGYIERLYQQFGNQAKPKSTPIVFGATLPDDGPRGDPTTYREIIGSLLFASIGTRPDITTAVSMLSRHMESPTRAHITAARHVVSYLNSTANMGLHYKTGGDLNIQVYCDASFAPDEHNRKSRTGWVILVNGTPVSWKSALQPVIAHSTAESEYIAMSDAAREATYIQSLLHAMGVNTQQAIIIHEDNQVAKLMAEEVATKRSKHVDIRYHHIRELVEQGTIIIKECRTQDMVADMLTKALPKDRFCMLRDRIVAKGEC